MARPNLSTDTLRTFVASVELGGQGRAAQQAHLTPAAISLQRKRLERALGVELFVKEGRGLRLTAAGEVALRHARRILRSADDMVDTVRGASLRGTVRVGCSQDFAESVLPTVLSRFAELFPLVLMEVRIEGNGALADAVERRELDLALVVGQAGRDTAETVGAIEVVWIADPQFRPPNDAPLPLVMLGPQCAFRKRAIERLEARHGEWRLAATSPSLAGLWASAQGGLGLTARTRLSLPSGFVHGAELFGLPNLGTFPVSLLRAPHLSDGAERLAEIVLQEARKALTEHERPGASTKSRSRRAPGTGASGPQPLPK